MRKGSKQKRVQEKPRAKVTPVNPNEWITKGLTKNACSIIQKAQIVEGCNRDTTMYMLIKDEHRGLFTLNIENRLLALFRGLYKRVILLEFDTIEEIERRKRILLLNKARRARILKEKQHQEQVNLTKNGQSATLSE